MKKTIYIFSSLLAMVRPLWLWMLLAITLGVFGFMCSILIPVLGALGLIKALGLSNGISYSLLFGLLAFCGIARGIFRYGEQASNHYIAFRLLALIRDHVFSALRRLCPAKLEGKEKGNLIQMLTSDVELLEVFYAHTISPVLIAFLMSCLLSALIQMLHPLLGLYALSSYALVGIGIPMYLARRCQNLGMESRRRAGAFASFLLESLRGMTQTLQYGAGEKRLQAIELQSEQLSACEGKLRIANGKGMALTNLSILALSLGMLVLSVFLYEQGALQKEGILLAFVTMISSFGPVSALANLGTTLQHTIASARRILSLLQEEEVVKEKNDGALVVDSDVELEHVDFGYDQKSVLKNVSLRIPKHQMTGIFGASGSGKSTLLKLLMRFWDVEHGKIAIGEHEIAQIQTASLRAHESYMTQETYVFHDTIENNIRFVKPEATRAEIEAACRKASIHSFIEKLPKGYQTNVAELGDSLSGGEKQRIGLARVFLHDADLILLDEPTSNLDSLNEAVILKALHEQKQEKTLILVSHRQSTLRLCDRCIEADFGRNLT